TLELRHLRAAHRGLEIRHLGVAAEEGVEEVLARDLAEVPDGAQPLRERRVVGDDHAALARGDDLVGVEAEAARGAEARHRAALRARARGLAGILDDGEAVSASQLEDGIEVERVAEEVHGEDGPRARGEAFLDAAYLEVVGLGIYVTEHRARAREEDGIGRGDARERRGDHLVAGTDAEGGESDVERGGARRSGHRGVRSTQAREGAPGLPPLRALGDRPPAPAL